MAIVVKCTIVGPFATFTSRGIAAGFSLSEVQGRLSFAFKRVGGSVSAVFVPTDSNYGTC